MWWDYFLLLGIDLKGFEGIEAPAAGQYFSVTGFRNCLVQYVAPFNYNDVIEMLKGEARPSLQHLVTRPSDETWR